MHLASLTTVEQSLREFPSDSLASVQVGFVRSLGFAIVRDPTDLDPSHAIVCPSPERTKAGRIAENAKWVLLRDSSQ